MAQKKGGKGASAKSRSAKDGGAKGGHPGHAPARDAGTGDAKRASASGPKASQKRAAEEREQQGHQTGAGANNRFLRGQRIDPRRIDGSETAADLIEGTFLAYNAARLREA